MPRYVIERDIAGIGASSAQDLCEAAGSSNGVIAEMRAENKFIQWEKTYIAAEKTFCIYLAENEDLIQEHAERSGFPATIVTEIKTRIDPTTAENWLSVCNALSDHAQNKIRNPRLDNGKSEEGFIALMNGLDLSYSRKIDFSMPGNSECGACPKTIPVEFRGACAVLDQG